MTAPTLLTVPEVLARLPVSRTTLYAMFKSGELRKRKLRGRTVVDEADLAALAEAAVVPVAVPRPKVSRFRTADLDYVRFFK